MQRVAKGAVGAPGRERRAIGPGIVVLLGIGAGDDERDAEYLADKIINLRVFEDENGKMNLSLVETGGEMLAISQFTLYGDCRKGRRPSFSNAAPPEQALALYEKFVREVEKRNINVKTGYFQEHMLVEIMNDGPVTLLLDSKRNF